MNEPVEIERRRRFLQRDINAAYVNQDERCALCPASIVEGFIADHRVPRAMGGKTTYANLQLICAACAAKKDPDDISRIAKAKRQGAPRKPSKHPLKGRGFDKRLRRHMDGTTSRR